MKKFLTVILSAICLVVGICFAGCDSNYTEPLKYYGVVQTLEGNEGLFVHIPEVGVCELPSYEDGQKISAKEGDLIRMGFEGPSLRFGAEIRPVEIKNPVRYMQVEKENVELFDMTNNEYGLTIDSADYEIYGAECEAGEYAELWTAQFLTGEGDGTGATKYGVSIVEKIADGRVTLRLQLNSSIQKFLQHFATGALDFQRIPISTFSFSLTWNTFGISSYDSETGKLVKTKDAPNPEDYITTHILTAEERAQIYKIVMELDMTTYPDVYDPHGNGLGSDPSMTIILSVKGEYLFAKTIAAEDIAIEDTADNEKGQRFLNATRAICEILTVTDEWKALPDYPYLYD